jgi:hypothetical protein
VAISKFCSCHADRHSSLFAVYTAVVLISDLKFGKWLSNTKAHKIAISKFCSLPVRRHSSLSVYTVVISNPDSKYGT